MPSIIIEDAEIYMNNVVDKKIAKGYEMMQRKIPVKQETKLETFSPITKESFFVKENPEQFLIIPELKSPEGTTPATRATQTVIVISDDEEIIEMPRNEIIYSKEKIREEVIDYDPIVAMLAEVEIFLNKPEPYKNFYLTRQIEENLEFCSLHIFKNTLVIEEGIEGVDKFPTVSRSFQNLLDAHLALKKIINDKLALNYQFNYDKLKEIQEQQMQEEEEQSDEDIFSKDPSINEE